MDSGYYAALSGLLARSQALDTAANNLANASTNGFRAENNFFRDAVLGPNASNSQLNTVLNDYGVIGGDNVDLSQGQLTTTGNPLDVALQGVGFFEVQTANGVRYTRDGSFQRASDGTLRTSRNERVLAANGTPIVLPPGPIDIAADGTISVAGGVAGRIAVVDFPAGTAIVPEGTTLFRAPAQSAVPAVSTEVRQGSLEGSNLNVVGGTMQLMLIQRQAEMMQKALSIFYSEFNKTATTDLGKV
ncbi:MAG TPA: flagellar basal-body rod protein FlgF [Granulicella sp.]|jgi:flagellar basal-body rod protein FlgF|nr:flagellar basal-body rod protein FlgF [Granulicella sp.]